MPFRGAGQDGKHAAAHLNPMERTAFREIGSRLAARLKGADEVARGQIEPGDSDMAPPEEFPVAAAPYRTFSKRLPPCGATTTRSSPSGRSSTSFRPAS